MQKSIERAQTFSYTMRDLSWLLLQGDLTCTYVCKDVTHVQFILHALAATGCFDLSFLTLRRYSAAPNGHVDGEALLAVWKKWHCAMQAFLQTRVFLLSWHIKKVWRKMVVGVGLVEKSWKWPQKSNIINRSFWWTKSGSEDPLVLPLLMIEPIDAFTFSSFPRLYLSLLKML